MSEPFLLHGEANSGAVAVEAALTLIGLPYRMVETTTRDPNGSPGTPFGQVPALRLPSGEVMTESAAILIWLADSHPAARLSPAWDAPERPAFLRWMGFVSSAIYAHYWALDYPVRLVSERAAQAEVRTSLERRIAHGWGVMEAGITPGWFLLGEAISVLDLYVTVVSRWTPRRALHEHIAPRIGEVVRRVEGDPRLAKLWAERFPLKTAE
jgi:GST-like protein